MTPRTPPSPSLNNPRKPIKVTLTGDILYLDIDKSTTCGLIVNEIIINAFKHAFIKQNDCKIDIKLKKDNSGNVNLIIKDNGIGVSSLNKSDNSQGLGSLLIEALTDQIGGEITISNNNGTTINLNFKS